MAPRKPRKIANKKSLTERQTGTASLLEAFEFVAMVQKSEGMSHEVHCSMQNGAIYAFNGILAAGVMIAEDLNACPHTLRMRDALSRCGQEMAITQMGNDSLSIKSERFRAVVPCIEQVMLMRTDPDAPCAYITDDIKHGFGLLSPLVSDTAETMIEASILLQNGSMVATNRVVMLEYWHGINLPPQLAIPKIAATTICRIRKPLVQLGFSANSVTFYFEDASWIRTQRYNEEWPDTGRVLNAVSFPKDVPQMLFAAVDSVASFSESKRIYLQNNRVSSHAEVSKGASFEVDDLEADAIFELKHWKHVEPHAKQIDFTVRNGAMFFFGNNIRGAIRQWNENTN